MLPTTVLSKPFPGSVEYPILNRPLPGTAPVYPAFFARPWRHQSRHKVTRVVPEPEPSRSPQVRFGLLVMMARNLLA